MVETRFVIVIRHLLNVLFHAMVRNDGRPGRTGVLLPGLDVRNRGGGRVGDEVCNNVDVCVLGYCHVRVRYIHL